MRNEPAERLKCVECGCVQAAPVGRGWMAYLTTDEEEPAEAIVYCPECAELDSASTSSTKATSELLRRLCGLAEPIGGSSPVGMAPIGV